MAPVAAATYDLAVVMVTTELQGTLFGLVVLPHNIYDPTSEWKRPEAPESVFIHFLYCSN